MSPRDPLFLGRTRKTLVQIVGLGVWLSGCVWLGLHYFAEQQTEFGPSPHPAEHWSLMAHGLFAFAALWAFGMLWSGHIVAAWKSKRRRLTGIAMFAAIAALIVSGYLLYYAGSDTVRPVVSLVHWALGLTLPAGYGWHRAIRRATR